MYLIFCSVFEYVNVIYQFMSRNARSKENDRFDEISSNRVNVRGLDYFREFLVKFVKAKSAWRN